MSRTFFGFWVRNCLKHNKPFLGTQSRTKKRTTTQPINNTGLGLKPRSAYIYNAAKSLGFRYDTKKEKTKPKDFAMCVAESKR